MPLFRVVKEFVANGRDLSDCFGFIGQMTTAKEDLKLKADKKGFTSDAEEFAALEQIKQAEDQLRELMQYYGRAGLWDDFVKFQAEARKARLLERNERIKNNQSTLAVCKHYHCWLSWTHWLLRYLCSSQCDIRGLICGSY
jgi:hypothetical protein